MSRKHFIAIAAALSTITNKSERMRAADAIAKAAACGFTAEEMHELPRR